MRIYFPLNINIFLKFIILFRELFLLFLLNPIFKITFYIALYLNFYIAPCINHDNNIKTIFKT